MDEFNIDFDDFVYDTDSDQDEEKDNKIDLNYNGVYLTTVEKEELLKTHYFRTLLSGAFSGKNIEDNVIELDTKFFTDKYILKNALSKFRTGRTVQGLLYR